MTYTLKTQNKRIFFCHRKDSRSTIETDIQLANFFELLCGQFVRLQFGQKVYKVSKKSYLSFINHKNPAKKTKCSLFTFTTKRAPSPRENAEALLTTVAAIAA